jgi:hypothetical protein
MAGMSLFRLSLLQRTSGAWKIPSLVPRIYFSSEGSVPPTKEVVLPNFGLGQFMAVVGPVFSGRSWTAAELRRKSFEDIHRLWYVLYKERNSLYTFATRTKRVRDKPNTQAAMSRMRKVKDSMAMIKTVLSERRKAFKEHRGPKTDIDSQLS